MRQWKSNLLLVMIAFVAFPAMSSSFLLADESVPALVVPVRRSTLHLAIDLPAGTKQSGGNHWRLVDLGDPQTTIPVQFVPTITADALAGEKTGRIVATIPPRVDCTTNTRRFRLEPCRAFVAKSNRFRFTAVDENSLQLLEDDNQVYVYNFGVVADEQALKTDSCHSHAGYIHPLRGLNGEVLTDDYPPDHPHHRGVFWAWPHIVVGNKQYNLWAHRNITTKFVRWLGRETGPVAALLAVENGWFIDDKKVMTERIWLQSYRTVGAERSLDINLVWIPVDQPITLRGAEEKSYGGLTVRFAVRDPKYVAITVPSGRAEDDLLDTPLPWADLTTTFDDASIPSGAAIFVPRDHPNYPPTWLARHYGVMGVGWPGVKGKTFEPNKPFFLHYRIWIHKTAGELDRLKQGYDVYAAAAMAHWE